MINKEVKVKKSHRNSKSCSTSEVRVDLTECPPDLTAEVKMSLEQEIASFDEATTLEEIELNAVGGLNAPGYAEWRVQQGYEHNQSGGDKYGCVEAEPDLLSEEEAVNLSKPDLSREFAQAKQEIDEILSTRELQVWRLAMRQGLSHKKIASFLHISIRSVKTYLQRSKEKVREHFAEGIKRAEPR
jgi:ATP/maltotriose-dependent transcriptional regulator MalT